jgi:hypothetical protein
MVEIDDALLPLSDAHKAVIQSLDGISRITILRKLGGGSPETFVFLVDVQKSESGITEGTWVLKLDPTWRARQEVESQNAIGATALAKYLPTLRYSIVGQTDSELCLQLSSLATGTFLNSRTLEQSLHQSTHVTAGVIERLAKILITEWNEQSTYPVIRIGQYLETMVKQLSQENSAGLETLSRLLDLSKPRLEGEPLGDRWIPNPLSLIHDLPPKVHSYTVGLPSGHVHGDFHPGNVLYTPYLPSAHGDGNIDLSIIDVATYHKGNVAFDIAYQELAVMWHLFDRFQSPVERRSWWGVMDHFASELVPTQPFDGIARANDAVSLLRRARLQYQKHAFTVFRSDEYRIGYLLASIEAGLTLAIMPDRIAKVPSQQTFPPICSPPLCRLCFARASDDNWRVGLDPDEVA